MRKAKIFSLFILLQGMVLVLLAGHSFYRQDLDRPRIERKKEMVRDWQLTDLCIFTEASYTRHLTQADRHTPFQNAPLSFEHFPSGSLFLPPESLKK